MTRLLTLLLISLSFNLWAWNGKGHVLISQMAYANLPKIAQAQANQYASIILSHLTYYQQQLLEYSFNGANRFAKISILPDYWRSLSLREIFQRFDAPIPASLRPYQQDNTTTWHFIDQSYPSNACYITRQQNVIWAIQHLIQAWHETQNTNTHAVLLVILTHLIGDAYQPLHTFSKVTQHCHSDQGGNKHFIIIGRNHNTNLHKLWDAGVGYLTHPINYQKNASRLQQEFPRALFSPCLLIAHPTQWLSHNLSYAKFIYGIQQHQHITRRYYQTGQFIARKQMTLASYCLTDILRQLLS